MDHLGVETVDQVKLAGAFGSQIDPLHAMILGLVPDAPIEKVGPAGNAAGTGALIALLSGEARREIEGVVRRVEKIETADRAALPGPLRRGDGDPPQDGPDPEPRRRGRAAGAAERARRRRPAGGPGTGGGTIHGRRVNTRRTVAAATEER